MVKEQMNKKFNDTLDIPVGHIQLGFEIMNVGQPFVIF